MPRFGALSLLQKTPYYKGGDRGAQAIARGGARCASHVVHRCAQAVARGAARCALHVHGRGTRTDACGRSIVMLPFAGLNSWLAPAARSAKADACGRSFAVLSTQVSAVGLRLGWRVAECLE